MARRAHHVAEQPRKITAAGEEIRHLLAGFDAGKDQGLFGLAQRVLRHLVGGMCETDFSGYPDCRDDTIKAQQLALSLGMDRRFVIHTPLMWIDKAATWLLARDLGGQALVDLIVADTHTCYLGDRGQRQEWGHGCGTCPACKLRADGYRRFIAA